MNTKLVESLVAAIRSLSPEEHTLLQRRLKQPYTERLVAYQRLIELKEQIFARRGSEPFDPPLSEYIQQGRDERTAQDDELVRDLFEGQHKLWQSEYFVSMQSFLVNLFRSEDTGSSYQEIWAQWQTEVCLIVAPTLMMYEVCNAFYRAMVAGQLLPDEAEALLERVLNLDIDLYGDAELHRQALKLAQRENLPATYDAHYVALAERLGIEFWAGDRRLFNIVRSRLPWVHLV